MTGRHRLTLLLALLAGALGAVLLGSSSAGAAGCPTSNRPNTLRIVGGSPQTGQLEKPFQTNLQVALANKNGCPLTGALGGISVTFSAPSSGASGIFAASGSNTVTVGTDGNGMAMAPLFTANDTAGSYSVHASSDYGSVDLSLTNTANGVVAGIVALGTTSQVAFVNTQYGEPLHVQVLDANGRPVQGATVAFSLGVGAYGAGAGFAGGGGQATTLTNASGQATSPPFVANGSPGRFTATASTTGISTVVTFALDNRAGGGTISAVEPTAQTATVDDHYAAPLQARVLDATGQPVEGVTVTFALAQTASGPGASFDGGSTQATETTDERGRAASPRLLANTAAGSFTATAAIAGGASPARFSLRNVAGAPATITAGAASGSNTRAGSRFGVALAVTVKDENSNPVAGVVILFAAPAHGPTGHFTSRRPGAPSLLRKRRLARVRTNAKGIAVAPPFAAGLKPGGYVVTATVGGTSRRATFALVNTP